MAGTGKSRPAGDPGGPTNNECSLQDTAYDRVVAALDAAGRKPTKQADGQTLARCSADGHDDRNPSLLVTRIEGRALVHCRAGCTQQDVVAGLGLTMADLFDTRRGVDYHYSDAAGQQTLRTVCRSVIKKFRQDIHVKGTVPLYRLPKVVDTVKAGKWVTLTEGEQDVHALESLGIVATTAPQGAASFHLVDVEPLRGAKVAVIPDVDAAGEKWASAVLAKLSGVAAEIDWRRPKFGKDAADHVAAGHGALDFEKRDPPTEKIGPPTRTVAVTRASDIPLRGTRWLWLEDKAHWLPMAGFSLLGGREGTGKTSTGYLLAAKITRGELPGDLFGQPRGVIISATEDAWSETVVPRLMANGADLDRVFRVQATTPEGLPEAVKLPDDLAEVERLVKEHDVALILLDPLMGVISGRLDSHKDHEIRLALEPIARLAADCGIAVLGLIHTNKSTGGDLVNRLMGSRAFGAVARAILFVATEDDVPNMDPSGTFATVGPTASFLLGQVKNNLAARVPFSIRYTIEGREVGHDPDLNKPIYGSTVVWGARIDDSVQDVVLKQESRAPVKETAADRAADWLESYLAERGAVSSADAKAAAVRAGHSEATVKRVLGRVGVKVVTVAGSKGLTQWALHTVDLTEPTEPTDLTEPTDPALQVSKSDQLAQLAHGSKTGEVEPARDPTSTVSPQGDGSNTLRDSSQPPGPPPGRHDLAREYPRGVPCSVCGQSGCNPFSHPHGQADAS